MSILKSIDMFGKEVKFHIDGRESFNTIFGGILSILVYLGMIAMTWYFGKDFYEKIHLV